MQPNLERTEDCLMLRYDINGDRGYATYNVGCSTTMPGMYEHIRGCTPRQRRIGSNCFPVDLCRTYANLCNQYSNSTCIADTVLGYQCLCPSGLYFRSAAQDECQRCTECSATQYALNGCVGTTNRVCRECQVCPLFNYFESTPCTPSSNRRCDQCRPACSGNTFQTAPCTSTSDRECSMCTTCAPGFNETSPCTSTLDRVCNDITPPSLDLLGGSPFFLEYGQDYAEPGFEARDRNVLLADDAVVVVTPQFGRQVCAGCCCQHIN